MFTVDDEIPDSHSHASPATRFPRAAASWTSGSGGGRASMALVPPAAILVAVDHQQGMLDAFTAAAAERGVRRPDCPR